MMMMTIGWEFVFQCWLQPVVARVCTTCGGKVAPHHSRALDPSYLLALSSSQRSPPCLAAAPPAPRTPSRGLAEEAQVPRPSVAPRTKQ